MSLRAELLRLALRWTRRRGPAIHDIRALRERLDGRQALDSWSAGRNQGRRTLDAGGLQAVCVITAAVARRPACPLSARRRLHLWCIRVLSRFPLADRDRRIRARPVHRLQARPEHPFPAAVDDAAAAYRWLLADGARPQRTALVGDSAGGGLVFAAAAAAARRQAYRCRLPRLRSRLGPISQ